ncbi:hemerythrin domain-containing protein [Sphingomonas sabuli]|uniref:Hemerythrin domain-containing protein n=1 Tax=Sphingomonas sabuli TaxID=2764186 RepID=A0A7G9L5E1_9SPHN|nr:hemerythrin domain-containing protein [Sphingomonas sabuli]QNM83840.1 hemerythrin domain-containing protein [Sphingomonas sabuli]
MAQDIFERLKQDHDKHRELIDAIKQTSGDSDDRKSLFTQFKTDAMAHAAAEEETLYVAMMADTEIRQDAQHSVKEHAELGMLFVEIDEMDMGSSAWLNKFNKLAEEYTHHIDEEEEEKFPKAREELGEDKAVALTAEFEQRKPEEIQRVKDKADVPEIKKAIEEEEGA